MELLCNSYNYDPSFDNKRRIDAWKAYQETNAASSNPGSETRIQAKWDSLQGKAYLVEQNTVTSELAKQGSYVDGFVEAGTIPERAPGRFTTEDLSFESKWSPEQWDEHVQHHWNKDKY